MLVSRESESANKAASFLETSNFYFELDTLTYYLWYGMTHLHSHLSLLPLLILLFARRV